MGKKRVVVGMSGGVDSSVVAALLKKRGYEVIGITFQLLPKEEANQSACCNASAIDDARVVADQLGIPHYTMNIRDSFHRHVIDPFVQQYGAGQTPNPCVACNRHIKFDALLEKAAAFDAPYIATGHYCQVTYSAASQTYRLKMGKDRAKDQSYFLYMLTQDVLARVRFPLGRYTKEEVRALAQTFGLVTAQKAESQDICFVASQSYRSFVKDRLTPEQKQNGLIVDLAGRVLGTHQGLYRYTVGQRRGLGLASDRPMYVARLDAKTNTVVVGDKETMAHHEIQVGQFQLTNPKEAVFGKRFQLKTRYQMSSTACQIASQHGHHAVIKVVDPQAFVSPGQSAVVYDQQRVVGGGIIAA